MSATFDRPPLSAPRRDALSAASLAAYAADTWRLTDGLFGAVDSDETLSLRPDPLRNPLIFYVGHVAAFYVNKLQAAGMMASPVAPELERRFAVGVDPAKATELEHRAVYPDAAATRAYRDEVRARVRAVIAGHAWGPTVGWDDPGWALLMALEHERIHFETSSVLVRQLPAEALTRPAGWRYAADAGEPPAEVLVTIPTCTVTLGRPADSPTYGWDNEYGALEVDVAPFEACRHLVSNATLLAFTEDGGYADDRLWSEAGRAWKAATGRDRPKFWRLAPERPGGWAYRAMFDWIDLPLCWPAELNYLEVEALCAWRGDGWRAPTEAEHAALAAGTEPEANIALRWGSPSPVGDRATSAGCHDVRGNVWQWLSSLMRPLPGFRPHPLYPDFSNAYFDDAHRMMAGGSWASTGTSTSRHYRNWFRPQLYQHAGVRLVRGA